MRILFVGDVMGKPGRGLVRDLLPRLIGHEGVDLTVVNAENASGGWGLSEKVGEEIFASGADVLTGGNHTWDRKEADAYLEKDPRVLRPHNYHGCPGTGLFVGETAAGVPYAVLNLQGRIFMRPIDCPFRAADRILENLNGVPVRLVDFHAEATSEKVAMGWYLDGRATAVLGTHTHVPTADARLLPEGAAYCTDVGMTGPYDSVIGMDKSIALERLLTQRSKPLRPAKGDPRLCCVLVDCDERTGRATRIEHRILDGSGRPCAPGAAPIR